MSQVAIELRIKAFEELEACAPADSGAKACCKTRGALRADMSSRTGNSIAYKCRTCGCVHRRTFACLGDAMPHP
jgi:hypothetical protein